MYNFLNLPKEECKTIFINTAQKMGVHEAIIEKDFWVCLVLDYLFHKCEYKEHFAFKGGTSLSKCFNLIKRFSEDIDLVLDWQVLGYGKDEPWMEHPSNTKQLAFNNEMNVKAEVFLADKFLPLLIKDLSEIIGVEVKAEIDEQNAQIINFYYPMQFNVGAILASIRLEIGALAAWTPTVDRAIVPYIFEQYPQIATKKETIIRTSSAERTFWEKATILHREANRSENNKMPMRYSRHYYDLYCIAQSQHKESALKQLDLLHEVLRFKQKFYSSPWAMYDEVETNGIKLVPADFRLDALRKDYKAMGEMLFGEYPTFEEVVKTIAELEEEINKKLLQKMGG